MQEGREGSGVEEMGQRIFGRRVLLKMNQLQPCTLRLRQFPYQYTTPTYNATTAAQTLILRYGFLCFLIVLWRYCREQCRTSTARFTCHHPRAGQGRNR